MVTSVSTCASGQQASLSRRCTTPSGNRSDTEAMIFRRKGDGTTYGEEKAMNAWLPYVWLELTEIAPASHDLTDACRHSGCIGILSLPSSGSVSANRKGGKMSSSAYKTRATLQAYSAPYRGMPEDGQQEGWAMGLAMGGRRWRGRACVRLPGYTPWWRVSGLPRCGAAVGGRGGG